MALSTIFWVFDMTQPGIEPQSSKPLVSNQLIWPIMKLKQFKSWKTLAMVCCIMVVGAPTHCELLQSMRDLETVQINVQYSLIQDWMLYEFEWSPNTTKATKYNLFCERGDAVDHIRVTRLFKKFHLVWRNFDHQERLGRPKWIQRLYTKQ